jgi:hypothetical protein
MYGIDATTGIFYFALLGLGCLYGDFFQGVALRYYSSPRWGLEKKIQEHL